MKKILSIILIAVVIFSLFAGISTNAGAASTKKYKNIIAKRYKESLHDTEYYTNQSRAFFYDFDRDGTKELAMLVFKRGYSSKVGQTKTHYLYIYTIKKGKVKTLVNSKRLGSGAGQDPDATIGIAKKKGKIYFFVQWTGNDIDAFFNRTTFYRINNSKATAKYKVVSRWIFDDGRKNSGKRFIKINGKKKTANKYNKFLNSFKYKKYKYGKHTLQNLYYKTR